MNGASVPATASASVARTAGMLAAAVVGRPEHAATGSTPAVAPRNWTAVTATGSRPRSSLGCATISAADSRTDARTMASPSTAPPAPPVCAAVTSAAPASDTPNPAQASGRATARCHSADMSATSTGTAPISSAAWLTLVFVMPAFCSSTEPP
ncbi:MAG TPA: hypothetical protein VFW16_11540 [Streptosporangiaceae bacterium]|nr:hypothetical protein [Streptosporangiaceae bacterium]